MSAASTKKPRRVRCTSLAASPEVTRAGQEMLWPSQIPSDCCSESFDPSSAINGISPCRKPSKMNSSRNLTYLSSPGAVSMADQWFGIASIDHVWVRRRFEVFRRLAGSLFPGAREIAEIGCGHSLVQQQIEDSYGQEVTGFDQNDFALKNRLSRRKNIYCYD